MEDVKIHVRNSNESMEFQRWAFSQGIGWKGGMIVMHSNKPYLYIEDNSLMYSIPGSHQYFHKHAGKRVYIEELIGVTNKQENLKKEREMSLKNVLTDKFVYVDEVAEILEIGFLTKKNVFLYGRGGHAKSEIMNEFLKYVDAEGKESFVQACGEGLTEEKLFGGLNLAKFQKSGEIEYLVENSFMAKKYVVFEELLDSRMNVLLSLKDILTSGIFRQGHQQYRIKTEFIVCLTNRTKQEVAEDDSVKALLERFPLEKKVEWDRYEQDDYRAMFSKVLNNRHDEVSQICHAINETGDFVSPRTAIHMAQVYAMTQDLSSLRFFGATKDVLDKVAKFKKEAEEVAYLEREKVMFNDVVKRLEHATDMDTIKTVNKTIKEQLVRLLQRSFTDKAFATFTSLKKEIEAAMTKNKDAMLKLIEDA